MQEKWRRLAAAGAGAVGTLGLCLSTAWADVDSGNGRGNQSDGGSAQVAGSTTAPVWIQGGSLALDFGDAQLTPASSPLTVGDDGVSGTLATITGAGVIDDRGTGQGWQLSVSSDDLREAGGHAHLTIPASDLSLKIDSVSPAYPDQSNPPTNNAASAIPLGKGQVTLLSAGNNFGMGKWNLGAITLGLHVPPSVPTVDPSVNNGPTQFYATITWNLTSGV
ncbi:WxL domain-containing protein [Alicyclobacillus shizuokensis]|uniref:WxL domain-containing protein n=1 Tax=Alicyclobacillus shizuokensis TaxID=392014 RepID=UPI000831870D|nr:WxL domain-containing protein [Alicyclobacillus shizuokensis]